MRVLRRAALRRIRFHALRHTCASLLIAQGAHPKYIQTQLGHASISRTLDRYGHLPWILVLAAVSMAGSFAFGTIFAVLRLPPSPWPRRPAAVYIDVMRTIPLIMVIFWVFFLLPVLTGRPTTPVKAALVVLIVFNTSYMADVIRAGNRSVPTGSWPSSTFSAATRCRCSANCSSPSSPVPTEAAPRRQWRGRPGSSAAVSC